MARRDSPVVTAHTVSASARRRRVATPPALTVSRAELLVDGSDKQFRHLVHSLFGFLARHEAIRDGHARSIGLAGIEYTVLIAIAHLSGEADIGVSAVAEHLHVTGAFITTVCRRLLALGLIAKSTDTRDRRRVSLEVTTAGRRRLEKLAPMQRQVNDAEFGCLGRHDFLTLLDLIERLIVSGDRALSLQRHLATYAAPNMVEGPRHARRDFRSVAKAPAHQRTRSRG